MKLLARSERIIVEAECRRVKRLRERFQTRFRSSTRHAARQDLGYVKVAKTPVALYIPRSIEPARVSMNRRSMTINDHHSYGSLLQGSDRDVMPTRAVAANSGVAAATDDRSCCARNLHTRGTWSYWITMHITYLNGVNDGVMSRQTCIVVSNNNNRWRTHTRGGE